MMIDTDDIDKEFLYMIIDALQDYELYRLCLIICNRYGLKDKIGQILGAVAFKYSNLKQFRTDIALCSNKIEQPKLQPFAQIARLALSNAIGIIDDLRIASDGSASLDLRSTCFDTLFLTGFWRELLYILDADSALQVAYAFGDSQSFDLLYKVYKKGCSSADELNEKVDYGKEKIGSVKEMGEEMQLVDSI